MSREEGAPRVVARPVRRAAVIVGVEGGLLLVTAVWLSIAILTQDEADLGNALVEVAAAAGTGLLLLALGHWLARGVRAARSPAIVAQVLALPVGWTLLGAGRVVFGILVLAFALPVLGLLLFAPEPVRGGGTSS